jgi:hypothetical protein
VSRAHDQSAGVIVRSVTLSSVWRGKLGVLDDPSFICDRYQIVQLYGRQLKQVLFQVFKILL